MPWVLRGLRLLLLLFSVSAATFVLAELAPGDYLSAIRLDPRISEQTLGELRQRYGLDAPLHERYLSWLASVGRGELGFSFAHQRPVAELLLPRARNTLLLTGLATALCWAVALGVGTAAALRPAGVVDRATTLLVTLLLAVPELLLALAGLVVAASLPSLPLGGMASIDAEGLGFWARLGDLASHLVVPVAVLVLAGLPVLVAHVRTAVSEALEAGAVHAARGHGIGGWRLLWGHVLPLAANPLVSLFGFSFGALLSGSLLVEAVLGWPGIGPLLLEAVTARDLHVVVAGVSGSCLFLAGGNGLADLILRRLDPRIEP